MRGFVVFSLLLVGPFVSLVELGIGDGQIVEVAMAKVEDVQG